METFFAEQQLKDQQTPSEFDVACATRLANAIRAARKVMRPIRESAWAIHFMRLRIMDKVQLSRVDRILEWYCANIKEAFVPQAYSGDAFRKKYFAIEAACWRGVVPPKNPPTEDTLALCHRLGLEWPHGAKEKSVEAQFVQASYDAYTDFTDRFRRGRDQCAARIRTSHNAHREQLDHRLMCHMYEKFVAPAHHAQAWATRVHGVAWRWANWQGHLMRWVWSADNTTWAAEAEGWCNQYTGGDRSWTYVLGLVA